MNFRKFKNVEYLEKLLAKKTEQLKMQRQKIEDIDKAIFFFDDMGDAVRFSSGC